MTILSAPPPEWKRPRIPLGIMVELLLALLRKLGVAKVNIDHRPPLSERQFDDEAWDTIPPANSLEHLEAMSDEDHDKLSHGPGGEKRITTAGSDANRRAKTRHLTKDQEDFRRKVLARPCGQKRERTGNWPKGRKLESRNTFRRRP